MFFSRKVQIVRVLEFLGHVQEPYRATVRIKRCYILEVPLGTVRSRISRGTVQLQKSILIGTPTASQLFADDVPNGTMNNPPAMNSQFAERSCEV